MKMKIQQPQHSILFIASEYDSGMRPYACTIIHHMWNEHSHAIVVVKNEKYKQDFAGLDPKRVHFISYPTCKVMKLWFKLHPTALNKEIRSILNKVNINIIYALTGELVLCWNIEKLQKRVPVLYTVHDAIPHETRKPLLGKLKELCIITWPQKILLNKTVYKITNSKAQYQYIKEHYKSVNKKVFYAPFPSLVNHDIASGGCTVPETEGLSHYILFFGNIHLYKGVDLLYNCYMQHPELHAHPLVIAGSGPYYFSRSSSEKNVVIINRFVDDKEVADLFSKAAVVVYPYISATQSGVISIASFFKKPIVLSDVPYFKEVATGYDGVYFFSNGNTNDMALAISKAASESRSTESLYHDVYLPTAMVSSISNIINETIDHPQ